MKTIMKIKPASVKQIHITKMAKCSLPYAKVIQKSEILRKSRKYD